MNVACRSCRWKMLLSQRRKVDTQCQVFQEKWTTSYLFTEVNGKPVCLVCTISTQKCAERPQRTLNATIRLIMPRITITLKDNWEQTRYENCWPVWKNSSLFLVIVKRWVMQPWKLATLLLMKEIRCKVIFRQQVCKDLHVIYWLLCYGFFCFLVGGPP